MVVADPDCLDLDHDPECCHCDSTSVRSASPAPSTYSFSSSTDGHILREVYGRTLNALCHTYMLPVDDAEYHRHDREHEVWKMQCEGGLCLWQDILDEVLAPPQSPDAPAKTVLDLGCGSGAWLRDMATRYPWVQFTGVDLAPQACTQSPLPHNITIEVDDVNLGLQHWNNQFNVVHARGIAMGIRDYKKLLLEIHSALRPGGLVLLVEPDLELFHDNGEVLEPAFDDRPTGSWTARALFEAYQAFRRGGSSIEAGLMHERWLSDMPCYREVKIEKIYNPIGPWMTGNTEDETRRLKRIGDYMLQNTSDFLSSLKPMMLADGFFPRTVELIFGRAKYEMNEQNLRRVGLRLFWKWHCASARKR